LTVFSSLDSNMVYSVYTVVFGFAAATLAWGIWLQKAWGTYGTVALSLFVIAADSLTVLDLPSIPGIPKFAVGTEILYSAVITTYLLQTKIRRKQNLVRTRE
jgi:uncharacterized membrane protein (DUF2068 family)